MVARVVSWYQLGVPPEEIAETIGHLSLAQVHAALAYYHLNRQASDEDLTAEAPAAEQRERDTRRTGGAG
jgi:uncharacterized protein (DUF433 family)